MSRTFFKKNSSSPRSRSSLARRLPFPGFPSLRWSFHPSTDCSAPFFRVDEAHPEVISRMSYFRAFGLIPTYAVASTKESLDSPPFPPFLPFLVQTTRKLYRDPPISCLSHHSFLMLDFFPVYGRHMAIPTKATPTAGVFLSRVETPVAKE